MSTDDDAMPSTALPMPILICHTCDPPRPMIIRKVKTSVLRGSQKILFACMCCGARTELKPALEADPTRTRPGP